MKIFSLFHIFLTFGLEKSIQCFTENDMDLALSLAQPLEINFIEGKILNQRTMIVLKAGNELDASSIAGGLAGPEQKIFKKLSPFFVWVMIIPKNLEKFTEKILEIPYNCQFIVAYESDSGFHLYEIFQAKDYSELIYAKFGVWDIKNSNLEESPAIAIDKYLYGRRKKYLSGMEMIAPHFEGGACGNYLECAMVKLWLDIGKCLNFTTKYMNMGDLRKENEKLQFDVEGFVKPFHEINPQTNDMVGPIFSIKTNIFVRFESDDQQSWESYLRPFQYFMWLALISWLLIYTILLTGIAKLIKSFIPTEKFSILDLAFVPLTAITNQGGPKDLPKISTRIGSLGSLITACIIVPAYSAAIISHLTIKRPIIPFNSMEGFVKDGSYTLTSWDNPLAFFMFTFIDDPYLNLARENELIAPYDEFGHNAFEMVQTVCKREKMALLTVGVQINKERSRCNIIKAINGAFVFPVGIQLKDDSPYKDILNELIFNARKSGSLYKIQQLLWFNKDLEMIREELESIDLQMTSSVFALLTGGIIFALMIFITEIAWNYLKLNNGNYHRSIAKPLGHGIKTSH